MKYLIPLLFLLTGCEQAKPAPDDGRGITSFEFSSGQTVEYRRVTIEGRDYYIFRASAGGMFVLDAPKLNPEAKP